MYFYQIKCCFYTQNGCMNKKILPKWLKWLNVPIQNKVFLSYLILIASIHDTTGHLI
jgi:hypothetical protein